MYIENIPTFNCHIIRYIFEIRSPRKISSRPCPDTIYLRTRENICNKRIRDVVLSHIGRRTSEGKEPPRYRPCHPSLSTLSDPPPSARPPHISLPLHPVSSDFQLKLFRPTLCLFPSFPPAWSVRLFIFQDFPLMPEGSEKEGLERAFLSLSGHSTTKIF